MEKVKITFSQYCASGFYGDDCKCIRCCEKFNREYNQVEEHKNWVYAKVMKGETIIKRIDAYNLIPDGCRVIPINMVKLFNGLLIGGILEDSIIRVHGICENGLRGFSCSVYYTTDAEYLKSILDYENKIDNFDSLKIK